METEKKLIVDGIRVDGRKWDELRDIKMKVGILKNAQGSASLEWGKNKVIAGVYGPREVIPKFEEDPTKAILKCEYNMAPFSVEDRKRPGPDRRSVEISKVILEALSSVVLVEEFPNTQINIYIEILRADAGTRIAGITAASLALADACIPMKNLIAGCTSGKVDDEIVLDLCKEEDNYGDCDLPVAIIPKNKEIVLLQMDGILTKEEFNKAFDLVVSGAMKVYEMQKKALYEKYKDKED